MIHDVASHVPHWRAAGNASEAPGRPSGALESARCDLCGELYDTRHAYEVLHHLHGRRYDRNTPPQ